MRAKAMAGTLKYALALTLVLGVGTVMGAMVEPTYVNVANYSPCTPEYKFDSPKEGEPGPFIPEVDGDPVTWTWYDVPSCDGTTSGAVTVALWIYTGTDGNQYVKFEIEDGLAGKVYVKGGPGGNLYTYSSGVREDYGLHAPLNKNGKFYGVSHVTFCLCYAPSTEEEWCGETAWAAGDRYVEQGNWAMYTEYPDAGESVDLIAGQFYKAGKVSFDDNGDEAVDITIELFEGFRFDGSKDENVAIQDYESEPSGNPAPGLFDWKFLAEGSSLTVTVPKNNFYGIHVNVERRCD